MASSSSSFSSSESWDYEVFLSFRGEDTRKNFVDHLYTALSQNGIHTYKDDETLPRGESIAPALFKAIEGSRIAVVVFSENYANSSWCLEEVAHIMKCKDERGQIVLPIFYHVDPSDVRKQKRKFEEAFAKHESEKNNRVEFWRKALSDAGSLSGWVPTDFANGHESKVIKGIVDDILNRLFPFDSNVNEDLVGMRTRLQDLKSKLEIGSGNVRMVGIWGVGGGGKTTLASSLYDEISSKFGGCCFIENIREESGKRGLEKLQEKILSRVLKNNVEVERVDQGKGLIKRRLCHKNVLIVLDDVDHIDQLKALVGSHDWFGGGSRIIITTRDEHLLKAHRTNVIYNISLLNDVEANKLFRKHAISDYITIEDYETLSRKVISYASGLPLALKVLGSFLCDKDKNEWMSALARLKDIPDDDIMEKLKISYDGLKPVEKELFLDIACFFRWEDKDEAMVILDTCGFHAVIGIKVLIQKALITIHRGHFDMHDLVQEMGRYIVRHEHPSNPEKHNRVWKPEDVRKVCDLVATQENDRIEVIRMDFYMYDMPHSLPHAIQNMKKLRWIDYYGYRASVLPTRFQPVELCYLRLNDSLVERLWEGYKYLPRLKVLNLDRSSNLIETPDLSGLPCLEKLILTECVHLKEIHPSIGYHERLVFVDMENCSELEMFPPIVRMKKLETLIFSCCDRLGKFPEIQTNTDGLKHLHLDGCGIEVVPSSIGEYCTNLESLDLSGCFNLTSFEASFRLLKHLKTLRVTDSYLADEGIPSDICESSNLETLDISGNEFSRIGSILSQLPRLKFLNLSNSENLVELPDLPSSISILEANRCELLEIAEDFPTNCKWLWNVSLMKREKGGQVDVERIIESMLEGNAIEDHFMSLHLGHVVVPIWRYHREIFRLQLPQNWDNDFTGFLIRFIHIQYRVRIIIKQEMHKEDQYDEWLAREIDNTSGMCYISFGSLRHTSWWDSIGTSSQISFSISGHEFKVELVPRRRSNCDSIERANGTTTNCSEAFKDHRRIWDEQTTFTIKHDSKSFLEIHWQV